MENEFTIGVVDWTQVIYLVTFVSLASFMLLEALLPRRKLQGSLLWRWGNNFSLALLTWFLSATASALITAGIAQLSAAADFGVLRALGAGPVAAFAVLLFAVQFLNYGVHIAFHKIPFLWPLHAVHHTDIDVDVSTSYRHHPLEPLVSLPLFVPLVLVLGPPVGVAVAYKLFEIAMTVFTHSNVRLPAALDRVLRLVLVTPDFHRLHHCSERKFTDSNYGGVLTCFDYVFRTASDRPAAQQESMELGLEYRREAVDARLDRMLVAPFTRARRGPVRE